MNFNFKMYHNQIYNSLKPLYRVHGIVVYLKLGSRKIMNRGEIGRFCPPGF